jgi:hypothetical protein
VPPFDMSRRNVLVGGAAMVAAFRIADEVRLRQ